MSHPESPPQEGNATPEPLPPFAPPSVAPPQIESAALDRADHDLATALSLKLARGSMLVAGDAESASALAGRHPGEKGLVDLSEAVLLKLSLQERQKRRLGEAASWARQAAALAPASPRPHLALMELWLEASDWAQAEAAARSALSAAPDSVEALRGLGYALYRQDRNREATDALRAALDIRPDAAVEALLARVMKGLDDQRGMTEQQLSHFTVHYDGEAHEDVGREILRALERHYATLISALDHEPKGKVSVILFSREGYYTASGAPAWSGGAFDAIDGRIRIPIGGLTTSLTPDMDETLIHELTHAFIADRSRNVAPRDIHEGLAQYMQGKRITSVLSREELGYLADGRIQGVPGFYLSSLAFVEYLIAQRGMGGMNDLLRAFGETGSVNSGFERVYGQGASATQQAWSTRFRQEHGS